MGSSADMGQPGVMPRVLLAEDNEINQEIACELLGGMNVAVTVAENGEQAVEAVRSGQYDAILMDIEMPVMDGLEATRRIRASGIPWAEQVPIIAMTGHSLSDGHESSQAAGMNAHLTKPIDPQALRSMLATWLPQKRPTESAGTDNGASHQEMSQLYGINTRAGIANVAGNEKLYFDLLRRFAGKYRDSQHELQALLERGDIESASRLAHTIKGVAANLGAVYLADMAKRIEAALLAKESIEDLTDPYAQELTKVAQGIEQMTSGNTAPQEPAQVQAEVDAESVPLILQTLEGLPQLMQTDWGQAQEIVDGLAPLLECTMAASVYARLHNALEEFDPDAFAVEVDNLAGLLA